MKKVLTIIPLLIFAVVNTLSLEMKATVTVNTDLLDINARNQVSDIAYQLENYINNTRFVDVDLEGEPIAVNLNITFRSGGNGSYSAQLYVEGLREVAGTEGGTVIYRGVENEWMFNYNQGAIQTFNTMRFDNLATIIDYYMLLVIGLELDTYSELGGAQVFNQLRQIVSLGGSKQAPGFEMRSSPGEFTKYNLVTELTDPRFDDFRLYMYDYYVSGLDLMAEDDEIAMLNLEDIIKDMATFKQDKLSSPSVLMQMFFDSKALELASIFSEYEEGKMLDVLRQLDPSNGQVYNNAR